MKNHSIYKLKISYICTPTNLQAHGRHLHPYSLLQDTLHLLRFLLHIPQRTESRYIHALCKELQMRKEYLRGEPVETIYFGGGTPSQLAKRISAKYLKPSGNTMEWNTAGRLPSKLIPMT